MWYLIDEIGTYEYGFGDQCSLSRQNYHHTCFMGELCGDTPLNLNLFREELSKVAVEIEHRLHSNIPLPILPKMAELLTQHSLAQELPQLSPDQLQGSLSSDTLGQQ